MSNWLSALLEIIKITVPALIVFLTVYYLMKTYLDKQYQLRVLEFRQNQNNTTIPARLQAYERLSLFCERIAIPSLMLRLREEGQSNSLLRMAMLLAIQQEFEYNITQQVYVSDQLWQIIKISRDNTVMDINGLYEKVDPKGSSKELASVLLNQIEGQSANSLNTALMAIKKEASILM
ncbi:MAG: hypothetical protein K9J37_11235 [Saprospiraceae bacterium]|nr:hypothetical protein [Saprospiraceae bacterium]MCF8250478.1 hypothetical protein [Saprospiraceae bacterium]MCF8281983.1 hypothetical protein [Bacteroidales bacterium]MCF8312376.1 hypothetical protein [Saprospiraceae bacterium]MCF8440627.1 hypothetical protein [Saprospiraceae bacterium]